MKAYQTVNYASPKEYRAALAAFRKDCLEPVRLGWLAQDDKILSSVVQVDATNRPDLGDLARVHRSEGNFDTLVTWDFCIKHGATGLARLTVEIKSPVKTSFRVIFQLASHYAYLSDLARNFDFLSLKFSGSNMEDVISYHFNQQTLKEGLFFYISGRVASEMRGGR